MFYELCLFNALIGLRGCFFDQNGKPFTPCKLTDQACLIEYFEKFITETAHGIPQYNIKTIDPMLLPDFTYDLPLDIGITDYLQNTNVTGIKNMKISKADIDMKNKRVTLKSSFNLHIVGDLQVIVKGKTPLKTLFVIDGKTEAITDYSFTFEKRDTGLEYLMAGAEITTFLFDKAPTYTVEDSIFRAMENDTVLAEKLKKCLDNIDYVMKYITSAIMKKAFPNVIHNLRQFAKILPMNSIV